MMNKAIIMGRLCADPEFRTTQSNIPCCRFRVAVNRPKSKDGNQEADFINCVAWRSTAEFVSRYFSKGSMIIVDGQLRNNDYTDNNGVKTATEVIGVAGKIYIDLESASKNMYVYDAGTGEFANFVANVASSADIDSLFD